MSGIIVGVDASDNSERALEWAMRQAAATGQEVTAVAVHEVATNQWTGNPLKTPGDQAEEQEIRRHVEEKVGKVAARLGSAAPSEVGITVVTGVAARALVEASEHADQLVIGSRGGGGLGRMLMGSVSVKVVQHADCTVTVVR